MAFRFTLDPVLRYRQSLEEQELRRLQLALAERAQLVQKLEQAEDARRRLQSAIERAVLQAPIPAVELTFCAAKLEGIARWQESLRLSLTKLDGEIAGQRARYRAARQRREILGSLRELRLQEYRVEQQRREQAMIDELHLLRRAHPPA